MIVEVFKPSFKETLLQSNFDIIFDFVKIYT